MIQYSSNIISYGIDHIIFDFLNQWPEVIAEAVQEENEELDTRVIIFIPKQLLNFPILLCRLKDSFQIWTNRRKYTGKGPYKLFSFQAVGTTSKTKIWYWTTNHHS